MSMYHAYYNLSSATWSQHHVHVVQTYLLFQTWYGICYMHLICVHIVH